SADGLRRACGAGQAATRWCAALAASIGGRRGVRTMLCINNAGPLPRGRRRGCAGFLKSLIGSAFILMVLGLSPTVGLAASKGVASLTDSPGSGLVGDVLTV